MAINNLYLRWNAQSPDRFAWISADGTEQGIEPLTSILQRQRGARITLLVPAQEVLLTQISVPTRNRQRLLQALPYALEEQLAEDVDGLHFVLGGREPTGAQRVAVVSRARMAQWLLPFQQAGVRLHRMVPDLLALPWQADQWSLLLEPGAAMLRCGAEQGARIPLSALKGVIEEHLSLLDEAQRPHILQIYVAADMTTAFDLDGLEIPHQQQDGVDPLALLMSTVERSRCLNLLQGDFSPQGQWGRVLRPWRGAALLALLWGALQLTGWWMGHLQVVAEDQRLELAIEQSYRSAFPEAKRIVNARVQMERKLAELSQVTAEVGFSLLMSSALPLLVQDGSEIQVLRYKQGQLDIDLNVPDLATIDRVKLRLQDAGLKVTIQSASSRGSNRVNGRLIIEPGVTT